MNKRLVMWGTFLVVFFASIVGSYKFINRNNQDLTIELSGPTLPVVDMVLDGASYNTLHGYTANMDAKDVTQYIYPVDTERKLQGKIRLFGTEVSRLAYEVRNSDGSRLIEAGVINWEENILEVLEFGVKLKDLIELGEEYIFTIILDTDKYQDVRYYTRFVYSDEFDVAKQMDFVKNFHEATLDKSRASEIRPYMEPDSSADNTTLAYVDIHSSVRQVVWGELPVEVVSEPQIGITYLQDNYGGYTLDYYVSSLVNETIQYYHVIEDFLVSTYGDTIYLLDYQRTADCIFQYENDLYQNNKIDLNIQSEHISVVESDDGNMAAFVVNGTLFYYDDVENKINYVYGFLDESNNDERSAYFHHDIKVLQVDESGSMFFVVYGYMNRGNHEGKTGVKLFSYNGQSKLVEELAFWQSCRNAAYVVQETEELSYMSRREKFYFMMDGNIVVYDLNDRTVKVEITYDRAQRLYISGDHSSLAVDNGDTLKLWNLETGNVQQITSHQGDMVIPQGFIGEDFVYGLSGEADMLLQSDGTYAQYMREIVIQDAYGELLKRYSAENMLVSGCSISGSQIFLERVKIQDGRAVAVSGDQIVARKGDSQGINYIQNAITASYQTIKQVSLKNKIDISSLEREEAKEVFYEGSRDVEFAADVLKNYCAVYSPWRIEMYVQDAGEAVIYAETYSGSARDAAGALIWKKEAASVKNQIMAIKLEEETTEKSSKNICLDIMLRQVGNPQDIEGLLAQGKTCQEILGLVQDDFEWIDITGCSLSSILYYIDRDIPIMVLFDSGEAMLITGFNQFNIVVMDPVAGKLGYMSRSDAAEMLQETRNQVFTYYRQETN